jgi:hypothetical protein
VSASLETAYTRSERMVGRRIADEYVLVPLVGEGAEIDSLFNLSRVATFIWEQLDGNASGAAVVAAIVERFLVARERAEADYLEFVEQLLSIGAIRAV